MKIRAALLLFLGALTATAQNIRQHAHCRPTIDLITGSRIIQDSYTEQACGTAEGQLQEHVDGVTCTLTSAQQIKDFAKSCDKTKHQVCFRKQGDEQPGAVPACSKTKKCPLGNGKCGCLGSDYTPSKTTCTTDDKNGDGKEDGGDGQKSSSTTQAGGGSQPTEDPKEYKYVPYQGPEFYKSEPYDGIITAMGIQLVNQGCDKYDDGPGPQWTEFDREAYKCWQEQFEYTGKDADGWPGKETWDELYVLMSDVSQ